MGLLHFYLSSWGSREVPCTVRKQKGKVGVFWIPILTPMSTSCAAASTSQAFQASISSSVKWGLSPHLAELLRRSNKAILGTWCLVLWTWLAECYFSLAASVGTEVWPAKRSDGRQIFCVLWVTMGWDQATILSWEGSSPENLKAAFIFSNPEKGIQFFLFLSWESQSTFARKWGCHFPTSQAPRLIHCSIRSG